MNTRSANCPSCGGDIRFRPGTVMSVCTYCSSVVARGDRKFTLHGKVAALVDTHSPLKLYADGRYKGSNFALVGRTQLNHPAGGTWDEWYLAFDDGRWGWLAEAMGRFYLTFESNATLREGETSLDDFHPGQILTISDDSLWTVAEVGTAAPSSAVGELPYEFKAGETSAYVDAYGPQGAFATFDFSDDSPVLYVGKEVQLAELSLQSSSGFSDKPPISTESLSCPHCAAPVPLRLPDRSQHVTCSSCNSLLDVNHGNLAWLSTLPAPSANLRFELGSEATFYGQRYSLVGYVRRFCVVERIKYYWDEYLLYTPELGYRWLIDSDRHFTFVRPLSVHEVRSQVRACRYGAHEFRQFQVVTAEVDEVRGEFYWKVQVGEQVLSADYVKPPEILSKEVAEYVDDALGTRSQEVAWSHGTYMTAEEVWSAFGRKDEVPEPHGIASNQPNPYERPFNRVLRYCSMGLVAFLLIAVVGMMGRSEQQLFAQRIELSSLKDEAGTGGNFRKVGFTEPFQLPGGRFGMEVSVSVPSLSNSWVYVVGALISEETGEIQYFELEPSYYSGVDGGESWSEGSRTVSDYLQPMKSGSYVMRLEVQAPQNQQDPLSVELVGGQTRWFYPIIALIVLVLGPMLVFTLRSSFEQRRWNESMFSDDDDD
ncbi:MAG: DUF4178 domain-containing protein [Myxococcota bacterium]